MKTVKIAAISTLIVIAVISTINLLFALGKMVLLAFAIEQYDLARQAQKEIPAARSAFALAALYFSLSSVPLLLIYDAYKRNKKRIQRIRKQVSQHQSEIYNWIRAS